MDSRDADSLLEISRLANDHTMWPGDELMGRGMAHLLLSLRAAQLLWQ